MSLTEEMTDLAKRARLASRRLASLSSDNKNKCLLAMADAIEANAPAIQQENGFINAPDGLPDGDEHFALEVQGDSMIEAGILEGDLVICKRTESANTGDIVVALIDGEEATLKRLRRKGASVALEAANSAYETRIFGPDRVQVQGRLVALIRRYE